MTLVETGKYGKIFVPVNFLGSISVPYKLSKITTLTYSSFHKRMARGLTPGSSLDR